MKPSDLPKNKRDSIRINEKVARAIREKGLSAQKILDKALDELFDVKIDVEEKEK